MIEIKKYTLDLDGDSVKLQATCSDQAQAKDLWRKIMNAIRDVQAEELQVMNAQFDVIEPQRAERAAESVDQSVPGEPMKRQIDQTIGNENINE